jgi:hypothetical protein
MSRCWSWAVGSTEENGTKTMPCHAEHSSINATSESQHHGCSKSVFFPPMEPPPEENLCFCSHRCSPRTKSIRKEDLVVNENSLLRGSREKVVVETYFQGPTRRRMRALVVSSHPLLAIESPLLLGPSQRYMIVSCASLGRENSASNRARVTPHRSPLAFDCSTFEGLAALFMPCTVACVETMFSRGQASSDDGAQVCK